MSSLEIHNHLCQLKKAYWTTAFCIRLLVANGTYSLDLAFPAASDSTIDRFPISLELRFLDVTMLEMICEGFGGCCCFYRHQMCDRNLGTPVLPVILFALVSEPNPTH